MRILMLDNEFPPLGGGMGTVNQALLREFAACPELEVDLITSALGGRREVEQFSERIRLCKVPVWNRNLHHSTNRELSFYAAQALPLALHLHRRQAYDFCFAWSTMPAGAVALALHRLANLPYLVWVTGPDIPGFERRYRYLYPLLAPLIRRVWRRASIVVAKCEDEREMIGRVDGRVAVTLIPNGVDLAAFRPGGPVPDGGPLRVLCSARLIERKGQHYLIEAVARLVAADLDVVLDLVGTGDALDLYRSLARRLGVAERVHFHGYVPREQIPAYYAAAHVFALPSYNEGMSLATLEAMAAGLPIVVTPSGTAELVGEGDNGFVCGWADVEGLANALGCLAQDRALARQMGAASAARASAFAWPSIAGQYLELFEQIAQE